MTSPGQQSIQTPLAGLVQLALTDPGLQELTRHAAEGVAEQALVGPVSARLPVAAALAAAGPVLVVRLSRT